MYEYLKQRIQTDTNLRDDSQIKIFCNDVNSVPEELKQFAEDIAMRVGTFEYKNKYGDSFNNGFLIKHEGVTMLFTWAYWPSSGCFKLNNSTELQINCDKSNWLNLGYYMLFGVSEHLDKIGEAGF
jgi:hypothetical protein